MKKLKVSLLLVVLLLCFGCGKEDKEIKTFDNIKYYETDKKTNNVIIDIENDKKIMVELYPKVAPKTVANFKKLVANDFYNDVIFHRVVKDFVIQAGDASSLGRSTNTIKGEFSANGVKNDLSHTKGIISMARNSISMDSASSQFFIMLEDNTSLDGQYAAFGKVIAGMDVVEYIGSVVTDSSDKPLKDIKINKIFFVKVVN